MQLPVATPVLTFGLAAAGADLDPVRFRHSEVVGGIFNSDSLIKSVHIKTLIPLSANQYTPDFLLCTQKSTYPSSLYLAPETRGDR